MNVLAGKHIALGVTSSIAVYRACDMVRLLRSAGAEVHVVLTRHATEMISPKLFASLSGQTVAVDDFGTGASYKHLDLSKSDLLLVLPATANFIGKAAGGIADDLLSTTYLATNPKRVMIAPAMNTRMWEHPALQRNLKQLAAMGSQLLMPENGNLACGDVGMGRLINLGEAMDAVEYYFTPHDMRGLKVLVTAGPTKEAIDPVRFISNHASGRMGIALAKNAWLRGAEVELISGPTERKAPLGVKVTKVVTAIDMHAAVLAKIDVADVFISSAAVSDFRPEAASVTKLKRGKTKTMELKLILNPDILADVGNRRNATQTIIGFALESTLDTVEAKRKLKAKRADLIVLNTTKALASKRNQVILVGEDSVEDLPEMFKEQVADRILDRIVALRKAGKR